MIEVDEVSRPLFGLAVVVVVVVVPVSGTTDRGSNDSDVCRICLSCLLRVLFDTASAFPGSPQNYAPPGAPTAPRARGGLYGAPSSGPRRHHNPFEAKEDDTPALSTGPRGHSQAGPSAFSGHGPPTRAPAHQAHIPTAFFRLCCSGEAWLILVPSMLKAIDTGRREFLLVYQPCFGLRSGR